MSGVEIRERFENMLKALGASYLTAKHQAEEIMELIQAMIDASKKDANGDNK